jgi:hypothetical protein
MVQLRPNDRKEERITMSADNKQRRPRPASERDHLEKLLDQALADTFPASDPVALDFERPAAGDADDERDR